MKLSPLQVKHYHFTTLSVIARPDVDLEKLDYGSEPYPPMKEAKLHTKILLGEPDGESDPHQFIVMLVISSNPDKTSHFPYQFAASLEGVFMIEHDGSLEERKRLVVRNGVSILYSAAREQLLSLTARHKYGPMLLPAANFSGLSVSDKQSGETISKARKKVSLKPRVRARPA